MVWSFVSASPGPDSGFGFHSSYIIPAPAGIQNRDLLVLYVAWTWIGNPTPVQLLPPGFGAESESFPVNSRGSMSHKIAVGESGDYEVDWLDQVVRFPVGLIACYRNVGALDKTGNANASATPAQVGTASTNVLHVVCGFTANSVQVTADPAMTDRQQAISGGAVSCDLADELLSSTAIPSRSPVLSARSISMTFGPPAPALAATAGQFSRNAPGAVGGPSRRRRWPPVPIL